MRRIVLITGLTALLLGPAGPSYAPDLGADLPGLLRYARLHHPEQAAMRAEVDAAEQRVTPAGALPDPIVRVELQDMTVGDSGVLPSRVGGAKYTLMQPLPFFGKRDLRRQAAAAEVDVASARADAQWLDLATRIKAAYAQYALVVRSERLTAEIIAILTRLETIAQARYAGGLVPQQDAIRAQVERTAMQAEQIGQRSERRQLTARLNALLGRPADASLAEPADFAPLPGALDRAGLAARVREQSPQLATERARVAAAERSRDVVVRNRYPDFTVGVAPIQVGSRLNAWEVMVEVNIPLQQATRRAQEAEAGAMVSASRLREQAVANELLQQLQESLAAFDAAREMEQLNGAALVPQAEVGLRSASASYENGRGDFGSLLDAERQIRKARQDALKAAAEARVRLAEIERLVGGEL